MSRANSLRVGSHGVARNTILFVYLVRLLYLYSIMAGVKKGVLGCWLVITFLILWWAVSPFLLQAETDEERKDRLSKELQEINQQILKQQVLVEDTQLERRSLERDIDLLDAQIYKTKLGIKARAIAIEHLGGEIGYKGLMINELNAKLERHRLSLADLVRKTAEIDDYSLAEVMLSDLSLSTFFTNFENYQSLKVSLNEAVTGLKKVRSNTEVEKVSLKEKQEKEEKLKISQEIEKKYIEAKEREKEKILTITKGEEAAYKDLLNSQKKTAAEIKAQLFPLLFSEGGGIKFEEAVKLAQFAGRGLGVSTALILAILEQETNLGSNLGSCTYNQWLHGGPAMNPTRDQPPFLVIAKVLGFDPDRQEISCPPSAKGWGGAMGPSQFIPSTWAIFGGFVNEGGIWRYDKDKDKIRKIIGKNSPSNPFNNQDAFVATALLLRDNGADGTYRNDRLAALRYYAGFGGAKKAENQFYGDRVMQRKQRLAEDIKTLTGN